MKITIDTKEDSHEEIKKVIRMLQNLVNEKVYTNQSNIFNDPKETPTENVFGNLFGNDNKESKEESQLKEEKPSEEEKKDAPEIIAYDL